MERGYVYVSSHQGALLALFLSNRTANIVVLTKKRIIKEFCDRFKLNSVYFDVPDLSITDPRTFLVVKREISRLISTVQGNSSLVLSHNSYDVVGFALAVIWKKCRIGQIEYFPMDPSLKRYNFLDDGARLAALKIKLYQLMSFLFLEVRGSNIFHSDVPFIGVGEKFFFHVGAKVHSVKRAQKIRSFVFDKYSVETTKKILFIGTQHDFTESELKSLKQIIVALLPNASKTLFKPHPRDVSQWDVAFEEANKVIPAEFYISSVDLVIGFGSEAMRYAMQKNKVVISINRIVFGSAHETTRFCEQFLKDDLNSNFFTPSSIDELTNLICSVVDCC